MRILIHSAIDNFLFLQEHKFKLTITYIDAYEGLTRRGNTRIMIPLGSDGIFQKQYWLRIFTEIFSQKE